MIFKSIYQFIRFNFIAQTWNASNTGNSSLYSLFIHPTPKVKMTGQNNNLELTDELIKHDLPFLLANKSGITDLNLSHNTLGIDTISHLTDRLLFTTIRNINLSNNPLDEASRNALPALLAYNKLKYIDLSYCRLTEANFDTLIQRLKQDATLETFLYVGNDATPEQTAEITRLLKRNNAYHLFKKHYQKENILDLEKCHLDAKSLCDLAFYIEQNSRFFSDALAIKEIKIPNLDQGLTDADLMPLVTALKKNNSITSLTMDYRKVSPAIEEQIRTQLMLNKARKKLLDKPKDFFSELLNDAFKALIATQLIMLVAPAAAFTPILLSTIGLRFLTQCYFSYRLHQAKQLDFNNPENTTAIESGKQATNSVLAYLNPKCYTPMAYLGYTIEHEKLSTKYDVQTECFKPKMKC